MREKLVNVLTASNRSVFVIIPLWKKEQFQLRDAGARAHEPTRSTGEVERLIAALEKLFASFKLAVPRVLNLDPEVLERHFGPGRFFLRKAFLK